MAISKKQLAQAATDSMFTEAPKGKAKPEKRQQATPEPKRDLQTFSVKINSDVLKQWRTYTTIEKYGETGKLTEAALVEYMSKHKLTGDKLTKFNTLMEL